MLTPVADLVEALAGKVGACLENEDGYPKGTHHLLKRLGDSLRAITPKITSFGTGAASGTLLLCDIRHGVYDAEDVLDELRYRIILQQKEEADQDEDDVGKQVRTSWQCFRFFSSSHQNLDELREVVDRFDKLEREWTPFTPQLIPPSNNTNRIAEEEPYFGVGRRMKEWFREKPPPPPPPPVVVMNPGETIIKLVGRATEKEAILDFLMGTPGTTSHEGNSNNVEVLPIVGEGGVGKTSLARWAYNQAIVERHFHLRAWVHVTDQSVLERVVGEIVPSAASIELPQNSHDLDGIRLTLEKALQGRRLLIVLDGLWDGLFDHLRVDWQEKEVREWQVLGMALKVGEEGSRVLITTRNYMTARMTGTVSPIHLTQLAQEDCWSLLRLHAFGHECGDDSIRPEMERIAREIAIKLGGLPLAVKMLGSLLNSNFDISYWQCILSSKLWDPDDADQPPSESAVQICYEELPQHLKHCFAYCSIFPRNYGFEKNTLVRFWIAVGYIPTSKERKLEDIGRQCFDELTRRSFFEKKQYQNGYGIHDILHDHAVWVSRFECRVFERHSYERIPAHLCHLRIRADYNIMCDGFRFLRVEHVRSLIICGRYRIDGFADILKMFKGLRVLALSDLNIKLLPECIGELIHLRFLILHKLDVKELPESVCRLYHLQGLDVTDCENLLTMPSGLHNLVNLGYLRQ